MTLRFLGDVDASQKGALEAWLAEFIFEPATLTGWVTGRVREFFGWDREKRRVLSVLLYSDFRTNFVPWGNERVGAVSRRM